MMMDGSGRATDHSGTSSDDAGEALGKRESLPYEPGRASGGAGTVTEQAGTPSDDPGNVADRPGKASDHAGTAMEDREVG